MSIHQSALESLPQTADLPEAFLRRLQKTGPNSGDYDCVTALLHQLIGDPQQDLGEHRRMTIHSLIGAVVRSPTTLLGHCFRKPRGYAGDFEIIDKIYTQHVSKELVSGNWDRYFHSLAAPKAVCNRKEYLKSWLRDVTARSEGKVRLLNLASGPARDIAEFIDEYPDLAVQLEIDCVELDADAVAHARNLLQGCNHVHFHQANVFRYRCEQPYDLIWSAGLFDYFDDRAFQRIAQRFYQALKPGGESVIGNFAAGNPSLPQMVLQNWILQHRTEQQLKELALRAGADHQVAIYREAQNVNLFLHMKAAN